MSATGGGQTFATEYLLQTVRKLRTDFKFRSKFSLRAARQRKRFQHEGVGQEVDAGLAEPVGVATLPLAATFLAAGLGSALFQPCNVVAAYAYNDSIRSFDVTGFTRRNGACARDLPGKRTIHKNALERGSKGAGTTVSFSSHNSKNLQTNNRSGHAISKISHLICPLVKDLKSCAASTSR